MKPTYIILDIETTGLDPVKDRIIEIGAVRVNENLGYIDEYYSLVNPQTHVPVFITMLTHGLNDELLKTAPAVEDIRDDFLAFISDLPIIAHNASFEESFLKQNFKKIENRFMDSIEICGLFFPSIRSLKLDTIIRELNIRQNGERHRALDDARDLYDVLKYIINRFGVSSNWWDVANRFINVFRGSAWSYNWLWYDLVKNNFPAVVPQKIETEPVVVNSEKKESENFEFGFNDVKLESGSLLSRLSHPDLEERKEQTEYMQYVIDSFNSEKSLMIEGGTGIGKTIGYLIPTSRFSLDTRKCVIVSTKTKTLQQQIVDKDIPLAKMLLGIDKLNVVKVQGRNNYLCIRKMDKFFSETGFLDDFEEKYTNVFFYAFDKLSDVADITFIPGWVKDKYPYIARMIPLMMSEPSDCLHARCRFHNDCHYFKLARSAQDANIIVANHSLVMNWPQHLPKGDKIIFDEAHNLESEATEATTQNLDTVLLKDLLLAIYDVEKNRGILANLRKKIDGIKFYGNVEKIFDSLFKTDQNLKVVFEIMFKEAYRLSGKPLNYEYSNNLITYGPGANLNNFDFLSLHVWHDCRNELLSLNSDLEKLSILLGAISQQEVLDEEYKLILVSMIEKIQMYSALVGDFLSLNEVDEIKDKHVYWLEWQKQSWSFKRAMLDVATFLNDQIYSNFGTAVLTSATLRAGRHDSSFADAVGFNMIHNRINERDIISIQSPFDYRNNSQLSFLKDTLNPGHEGFISSFSGFIARVSMLLGGKTLVLFSSLKRMRQCFDELTVMLEDKKINIYMQGLGSDVVDSFVNEPNSLLLGSESFGEGLDIKGENLSCVILERMPIVRKDPVYVAREQLFRTIKGGSPYLEYEIPRRILKLRQWSGRLIRSKTDKGFVIVYDNWFVRQNKSVQQGIAEAMLPMPVACSTQDMLISWMEKRFSEWGFDLLSHKQFHRELQGQDGFLP